MKFKERVNVTPERLIRVGAGLTAASTLPEELRQESRRRRLKKGQLQSRINTILSPGTQDHGAFDTNQIT